MTNRSSLFEKRRPSIAVLLAGLACSTVEGCTCAPEPVSQPTPKSSASSAVEAKPATLVEARRGFSTKIIAPKKQPPEPAEVPPSSLFQRVTFPSPVGDLVAYVTPPPKEKKRSPAMVWIFGGFSNGIGSTAWEAAPPANDQSARQFREAGLVMMYPSRRGGDDNPGQREGLYGEVDDVLAAADWLAKLDYVDASRIYLGGHSTGGTLVLLVAEMTNRFRAVISFGPVASVINYGTDDLPFDTSDEREIAVRAPFLYVQSIRTPTIIIEGAESPNAKALPLFAANAGSAPVKTYAVQGAEHFNVLAPVNRLLARKVVADTGPSANIAPSEKEIAEAMSAMK